jgi:F0F1-type ATP synthase epsilon subunit
MQTLKLRIISPIEDVFDGEILYLSSRNSSGNFDVLPEHANFITLITDVPITVVKPTGEKQTFRFPLAVLRCVDDKIEIFTDIAKAEMLLPDLLALK